MQDDTKSDPNSILMPRISPDRKYFNPLHDTLRKETGEPSPKNDFEPIPIKPVESKKLTVSGTSPNTTSHAGHCPHCGGPVCKGCGAHTGGKQKTQVTSDNYQKVYIQEQKEIALNKQKELAELHNKNSAQDSKVAQEETNMRNQARDIQNQIRWWEGQRGQAGQDDSNVDGQISMLQQQLNGIPGKFWNS